VVHPFVPRVLDKLRQFILHGQPRTLRRTSFARVIARAIRPASSKTGCQGSPVGLEQGLKVPGKRTISKHTTQNPTQIDPNLSRIVAAWPTVPKAIVPKAITRQNLQYAGK
jgi:hypothetical protein